MTPVQVFPDAEALGLALAVEVMDGLRVARREGRRYLLGCPSGRSPRTTYRALARLAAGMALDHLVIVMMDEYLERTPAGSYRHVSDEVAYSCRGFAEREIRGPLNTLAASPVPSDAVWLPDPSDTSSYEGRIAAAGGVDLFIVASGTSDGHVAFMPPGSTLDGGVAVVRLAETTRRDNLATFPSFRSHDEVPTHGISVGLGTIQRQSRSVRLILTGSDKRHAAARVLESAGFDPAWPATFIHACRDPAIWMDAAARGAPVVLGEAVGSSHEDPFGPGDPTEVARVVRRALAAAGRKAVDVAELVVVTDEAPTAVALARFTRRGLGPHGDAVHSSVEVVAPASSHQERLAILGRRDPPSDSVRIGVALGPDALVTARCIGEQPAKRTG